MPGRFQHLLKQAMGLDANSIGLSAIMRAVERRARLCKIADLELYWHHLNRSGAELQALIEAVVVPETWFYRDREAFAAAAASIRADLLTRPAGPPLRMLSLPCSTGEEPFTLAMSLVDAGVPLSSVSIHGVDISGPALDHARAGIYGRNSFRGADLSYRDRHFVDEGNGYHIAESLRSAVHFSQGNIFALDSTASGSFDIIFCRNLLIYFDPTDQKRAIEVLRRLLAPTGTLFVGHSEASILIGQGFASLRIPHAFAFRKADAAEKPAPRPLSPVSSVPKDATVRRRPMVAPVSKMVTPKRAPRPAAPISAPAVSATSDPLADIRRAADRGELGAALKLGRNMLERGGGASAEIHYLMAVISEAAGDHPAATDLYRKTLYLEPNHRDALAHLTLLLERMGDHDGARRMGQRARRLEGRREV